MATAQEEGNIDAMFEGIGRDVRQQAAAILNLGFKPIGPRQGNQTTVAEASDKDQLARSMHLSEVAAHNEPLQHPTSQTEAANSPSASPSGDCPPFPDLCATTLPSTTSPNGFYISFLLFIDLAQQPEQLLL
ncbi:hypothetical protein BC830DRAFT_1084806 [Chytriomyces sp. MP71]|nr:hypothetical protein BC830DRAFT_1084806 [Chytriomyces sp. MP71]